MQASQTPTLVPLAFAANGTKNAIPENSQIGITPGAASLQDGFPPLTFTPIAAGGVPPAGADFNGILNLITQSIRWAHGGGHYGYNSAFASDSNVAGYPRGALLLRADQSGMWLNQTDGNTTNPDTGGAGWSAAFMSGMVGQARNLAMNVTAASATATMAADEIVVGSALGGQKYVLSSFSKTVNLATTGAGGMDTGSAPTSGYVALYAIFNPTSGASALLATNATSAVQPNVYGGANMPAGYTASALVSVWPTNASGQFVVATQIDRTISITSVVAIAVSSAQVTTTPFSISAIVPPNARSVTGLGACTNTAPNVNNSLFLYSTATQICQRQIGANLSGSGGVPTGVPRIPIVTRQTLYYTSTGNGTYGANFNITDYEF